MRAAVLHERGGDFVVEDVRTPDPGPGQVRVRIGGAGVCHSDLHQKTGEVSGTPLPLIMGHENAGWVDAIGVGVEGVTEGDPVVVFGGWGCGRCRLCLGGLEQLCDPMRWGGMGPAGGYAEYLLVPSARHLLPTGGLEVPKAAALTDAGLSPYAAVKKALPYLLPGSTAVVIGAGGLGQHALQYVKLLTSATCVVVDTSVEKRKLARELGADHAIDPAEQNAAEQIRQIAGGGGSAAVIDFVGVEATMTLAASVLGPRGIFVLVGLAGGSIPFSFFTVPIEAPLMTSNWGSRNELEEVIALAGSGRLTSTVELYSLDDINEVFGRLAAGEISGRAVLVP